MSQPTKPETQIIDEVPTISEGRSLDSYYITEDRKQHLKQVYISEGDADARIEKLAHDIAEYYQDRPFLCLILLRGGAMVYAKLQKYLTNFYNYGKYSNVCQGEFLKCSSYSGNESSGKLNIGDFDFNKLNGKEILIVEDIIDTGLTLKTLQTLIREKCHVKSLKTFVLGKINSSRSVNNAEVDFLGFNLPDNWYVGYCFEINDFFRDVKHICALNEKGINEHKDKQYFS